MNVEDLTLKRFSIFRENSANALIRLGECITTLIGAYTMEILNIYLDGIRVNRVLLTS